MLCCGVTTYLSSSQRHTVVERALEEDARWILERIRIANPAGHAGVQDLLVFVSADGEIKYDLEGMVRAGVSDAIGGLVPGATRSSSAP